MKKLTKQPSGKYYTRIANGGLNGAVLGKPTIPGANCLCNCVGFANGRFNQIINDPELKGINKTFKYQLVCNAENFVESAKKQGLKISSKPTLGGIMVWQKGNTLGGGDGAGHVAVVEEIYSDGSILTSESGWNAWAFKNIKRTNANGRWGQGSAYKFRGCIVNPAVTSTVTPVAETKLTVDGIGGAETVKAMQKYFSTTADGIISGQTKTLNKYYPALKAVEYGTGGSPCIKNLQRWLGVTQDGIIGQNTVKAWQKKLGVTADGIFGTASMKAWQKFLNDNWGKHATYLKKTLADKIIDACKTQADWEQNAIYKWQENPTIPKSKKKATCVTYVACVLQRLGYLKSGQYIWIDTKGKVFGTNNRMTVTYLKGTLKSNKSKFKKGDIVIGGNGKVGAGQGSHIFVMTGKWDGDNPYIFDQASAGRVKKGKSPQHTWKGTFKVIALIRLKEVLPEQSKGDKIMDACKAQADYMKSAKYGDYSPVTLAHSKTAGTCVTYEGVVFQRLGALSSGQYIWQNGSGYGTGKVTHLNSKTMTCTYVGNKTLSSLKSKIHKGDCVLLDDNKSGKKGSGGHVFFCTGDWSGTDPYIWDFEANRTCAKTGKPRKYSGSRKVLAIVRLK